MPYMCLIYIVQVQIYKASATKGDQPKRCLSGPHLKELKVGFSESRVSADCVGVSSMDFDFNYPFLEDPWPI